MDAAPAHTGIRWLRFPVLAEDAGAAPGLLEAVAEDHVGGCTRVGVGHEHAGAPFDLVVALRVESGDERHVALRVERGGAAEDGTAVVLAELTGTLVGGDHVAIAGDAHQ